LGLTFREVALLAMFVLGTKVEEFVPIYLNAFD
jgi:hypothetical protein